MLGRYEASFVPDGLFLGPDGAIQDDVHPYGRTSDLYEAMLGPSGPVRVQFRWSKNDLCSSNYPQIEMVKLIFLFERSVPVFTPNLNR